MLKSIKKAFGFVDDDELIADDPEVEAPSLPDTVPAESATSGPNINADKIFTHVVEVFNQSLPGFLKSGANAEAQRRYLYDTLSADIKAHLESLESQAREVCENRWRSDRESLNQKLKQVETRSKELEEKRLELSQKQLSADRQKRALSERVHDLEKQLSKLVADREQYDLENKSLINKLKVAGVFEKENEELRDELNRLQAENLRMRNGGEVPQNPVVDKSALDEAEKLAQEAETRAAEAEKRANEADARAKDATEKLAELESRLKAADEAVADAGKKLADAESQAQSAEKETLDTAVRLEELEGMAKKHDELMARTQEELESLRKDRDEALGEAQRLKAELDSANSRQSEASQTFDSLQAEITEHKRTIAALEKAAAERPDDEEIKVLRLKVAEADEVKAQIEAIESQIALFQDVKEKKDQQIATLKEELALTRKELAVAKQSGGNEDKRRDSNTSAQRNTRRSRKSADTPIDDILSDTDWLVAPPGKGHGRQQESRDRHQRPDNDSQLSLF